MWNKTESTRIVITLPDHVHDALKRLAKVEDVPMSAIMRHALVVWMQERGMKVRDDIVWGGARYNPSNKDDTANVG